MTQKVYFYGDLTLDVIDQHEQLGGSANCQRHLTHLIKEHGINAECKRIITGHEPRTIPAMFYDTRERTKSRGREVPSYLTPIDGRQLLEDVIDEKPEKGCVLVVHQQNKKENTFWPISLAEILDEIKSKVEWLCIDTRSYEFIEEFFEKATDFPSEIKIKIKISEEHLPTPNKLGEWSERATFLITTPNSCEVVQKGESSLWLRDRKQPSIDKNDVGCGDVFFGTWIHEYILRGREINLSIKEAMRLATKKTTLSFAPCVVSP